MIKIQKRTDYQCVLCIRVLIVFEISKHPIQSIIKYIRMKLDENERGNQTRLMKVKDMILEEAIKEKREADEAAFMESVSPGETAKERRETAVEEETFQLPPA